MAAEHGVALAVVGGIAFFILGWGLSGVFVGAFGASEAVSTFAIQYSHIAVGMSIFVLISMMCEKIQQSGGNMIIPMCQGLVGAIINIILDPLMIFGIGPFPELGNPRRGARDRHRPDLRLGARPLGRIVTRRC